MSTKRETAAAVGVGAAACAVCCAGPILGFLAAIGLTTAAGLLLFGAAGLAIAGTFIGMLVYRRRRKAAACNAEPAAVGVPVDLPTIRTHR